jgi:hypothetical protein
LQRRRNGSSLVDAFAVDDRAVVRPKISGEARESLDGRLFQRDAWLDALDRVPDVGAIGGLAQYNDVRKVEGGFEPVQIAGGKGGRQKDEPAAGTLDVDECLEGRAEVRLLEDNVALVEEDVVQDPAEVHLAEKLQEGDLKELVGADNDDLTVVDDGGGVVVDNGLDTCRGEGAEVLVQQRDEGNDEDLDALGVDLGSAHGQRGLAATAAQNDQ